MGAQSSSDSSVWGFSQTVVPCWNLRMAAVCVHIYLFDFLFFWRIFFGVSWEGGRRKEDQRLFSEFPALGSFSNEISHPQLCFLGEVFFLFFPFSPGKGGFPNRTDQHLLLERAVCSLCAQMEKSSVEALPQLGNLGFCLRGSLGSRGSRD